MCADIAQTPTLLPRAPQTIVMSKRQKPKKQRPVRLRKGALTSRSRRELGFHKLDRTGLKYADYVPLNDLWQQYMRVYLSLDTLNKTG